MAGAPTRVQFNHKDFISVLNNTCDLLGKPDLKWVEPPIKEITPGRLARITAQITQPLEQLVGSRLFNTLKKTVTAFQDSQTLTPELTPAARSNLLKPN